MIGWLTMATQNRLVSIFLSTTRSPAPLTFTHPWEYYLSNRHFSSNKRYRSSFMSVLRKKHIRSKSFVKFLLIIFSCRSIISLLRVLVWTIFSHFVGFSIVFMKSFSVVDSCRGVYHLASSLSIPVISEFIFCVKRLMISLIGSVNSCRIWSYRRFMYC